MYGSGHTFGDVDASNERQYMYTLRVKTSGVKVWVIDADTFMEHLEANARVESLKLWQKDQEQMLLNKLATNLFNSFRGMNIDGFNDFDHNRFKCSAEKKVSNFFQEGRYVTKPSMKESYSSSVKKRGRKIGSGRDIFSNSVTGASSPNMPIESPKLKK